MPITGQTAGPIGLKFFRDTHGGRGVFKAKKIRKFFFSIFFFQNCFFTGNAGPFS